MHNGHTCTGEVFSLYFVSSCGVKLQEVLSGLEKKAKTLDIHVHFCGFSQHSLFLLLSYFFLFTWGVITGGDPHSRDGDRRPWRQKCWWERPERWRRDRDLERRDVGDGDLRDGGRDRDFEAGGVRERDLRDGGGCRDLGAKGVRERDLEGGGRNLEDGDLGGRDLRDGGGDRDLGAGRVRDRETLEVQAETLQMETLETEILVAETSEMEAEVEIFGAGDVRDRDLGGGGRNFEDGNLGDGELGVRDLKGVFLSCILTPSLSCPNSASFFSLPLTPPLYFFPLDFCKHLQSEKP